MNMLLEKDTGAASQKLSVFAPLLLAITACALAIALISSVRPSCTCECAQGELQAVELLD